MVGHAGPGWSSSLAVPGAGYFLGLPLEMGIRPGLLQGGQVHCATQNTIAEFRGEAGQCLTFVS